MKLTAAASFWLLSGVGRVAKKFFGRPVEVSVSGPLRILSGQGEERDIAAEEDHCMRAI